MMKKIYIWLKRPMVLILLLLAIVFILKRYHIFSGLFASKPLLIDNTPLVIQEIRSIAELNTATLYQEIVVDSSAPSPVPFSAKREIVLIVKGKVFAGVDLQQIKDKDVYVKGDSVHITLPAATIRDVIINPSNVETFYEFGSWSNAEITTLKLNARTKLLASAKEKDLLQKADIKAKEVILQFLRSTGFEKIEVDIQAIK